MENVRQKLCLSTENISVYAKSVSYQKQPDLMIVTAKQIQKPDVRKIVYFILKHKATQHSKIDIESSLLNLDQFEEMVNEILGGLNEQLVQELLISFANPKELYCISTAYKLFPAEQIQAQNQQTQNNLRQSKHTPEADAIPSKIADEQQNTPNKQIKIDFICGDLTNMKVEVIVQSVGNIQGPLFKKIIEKGGPQILIDFEKFNHNHLVSWTRGYELPAEYVFHAYTPMFDERQHKNSFDQLKKIFKEILQLAENWAVKTLALPALGTGVLKFKTTHFVQALSEAISVLEKQPHKLQQVTICEFNKETLEAVKNQWHRLLPQSSQDNTSKVIAHLGKQSIQYEEVKSQQIRVSQRVEQNFGGFNVVAIYGDFNNQKADVILSFTDETLRPCSKTGQKIHESAGSSLKTACDQILRSKKVERVEITPAFNLKQFSKIAHIAGLDYQLGTSKIFKQQLKNAIIELLQECENENFTSVLIPTCTLEAYPLELCAATISDAIDEYQKDFQPNFTMRTIILVSSSSSSHNTFASKFSQ